MPWLALGILVLYMVLAFGLRSWIQWRRWGSTGFHGISGTPGSAEWLAGVSFVVAALAIALAPLAQLRGWFTPMEALDAASAQLAGLLLALAGVAATLWSQLVMGRSWRIGVDQRERTRLIVHGPFRWVRNPIFTSMAVVFGGVFLLTPTALGAAALASLIAALELQVRMVEEPYLVRTHGSDYRAYAARVGRFLPGIGRLPGGALADRLD